MPGERAARRQRRGDIWGAIIVQRQRCGFGGAFLVGVGVAQGVRLSEEQVETIRQAWVLTGNASYAAKLAGCSKTTSAKYVREHRDELLKLRTEKAPSLLETLNAVLSEVLAGLVDPLKIQGAQYGELSRTAGIVIDKIQLLSGQATARVETGAVDTGKLTPEEREQAARLRAKLAGEAVVR